MPATLRDLRPVIGELARVQARCGLDFDSLFWAHRHIQGVDAWRSLGDTITRYGLRLGPGVKERFAWSRDCAPVGIERHEAVRDDFQARIASLLGSDGVLLMPTMPDIAPLLAEPESAQDDYRNRSIRMLCLSGLPGFPQISLPLMSRDGAPLGFSLMGPRGSDRSLIELSAALHAV